MEVSKVSVNNNVKFEIIWIMKRITTYGPLPPFIEFSQHNQRNLDDKQIFEKIEKELLLPYTLSRVVLFFFVIALEAPSLFKIRVFFIFLQYL
jgi:hypothetical protein